ncbi:hypothetical protein B0H14DRAFT_2597798 [Mycena olivaceomarginata]|nr:hypothetical protein B0H14DRAFT_2597798 [Mycena olivaceomarginata]
MAHWEPTHERNCILPVDPRPFLNEEQRNLFVWNSKPTCRRPDGTASHLELVASVWVDLNLRKLSNIMFYRWLRFMCTPEGLDPTHFMGNPDRLDQEFCLLKLPSDPRRGGHFPVNDSQLQGLSRVPVSELLIEPGHYIIAAVTRRHGRERRISTYTFQKDSVRTKVRSRDLKCHATGQAAPAGSRGHNFTGLEVAHIFPLAEASVFTMAFPTATNLQQIYIPLKILSIPRKTHIDIVQNAFVLRGDVHTQFDGYQFAYEISLTQQKRYTVPQIRCFEKDGAPSINKNQLHQICPQADARYLDVNPMLLTHHFLTALLWHVSGNGLKAHDDAIIPTAFSSVLDGHQSI